MLLTQNNKTKALTTRSFQLTDSLTGEMIDDARLLGNYSVRSNRSINQNRKNQTLLSSWTPLTDRSSNKDVFDKRRDLVSHWFDLWNDDQRKLFLLNLLAKCRPSQLCFMENLFDEIGVYERKDFTQRLPKYLSIYIFSFLSPLDLARCAQVNSHWKYLSEQDDLWMPKCVKFGWYLPYKPHDRELGAWKAYFVECVRKIKAEPLSAEEAFKFRDSLYRRELTDTEKEYFINWQTKKNMSEWRARELKNEKKDWYPNSKRPKDLSRTDKLLYTKKANQDVAIIDNYPASGRTLFGAPIQTSFSTTRTVTKSGDINHDELVKMFKKTIPMQLLNLKDSYKTMRKSESDLFQVNLSKSSLAAYHTYMDKTLSKSTDEQIYRGGEYKGNDPAHVIFISSKVPCNYMLLECLKRNVTVIPYDFDSTSMSTLIQLLERELGGRKAKTIGFFLHFEKPGQLTLTRNDSIFKVNVKNNEISNFLMYLTYYMEESQASSLDFFLPLGSSPDGLELIDQIQKLTNLKIRAPVGYLLNYKYLNGKWLNSDSNPLDEYFVSYKLDLWLKYCQILADAHERIAEMVLSGYVPDVNKVAVQRIAGRLVFDSLEGSKLVLDQKLQNKLSSLIVKAASHNSNNFLANLTKELNQIVNKTDESENAGERLNKADSKSQSDMMRSDLALASFLKTKSTAEAEAPSTRTQIVLELVRSEINYMKSLEIIQKYYAKPLQAAYSAGNRMVISESVLDMIFGDLTIIYNVSKQMSNNFNSRIKNWSPAECIVDLMSILANNAQAYVNYADNQDAIISAIDKLTTSNSYFHDFLVAIDNTPQTRMMSIQELMDSPWSRIKEYMNLLSSLKQHSPREHPDQAYIAQVLNKMQEVYLYFKKVQDRAEKKYQLVKLQRTILNCPDILKGGRHLVLQEKAILLNRLNYNHVKDLSCFVFNDGILFAYRVKNHFAFKRYVEETLIFFAIIEDLHEIKIEDIVDRQKLVNAIRIESRMLDEYILAFETYEAKFNFLNALKLARKQATHASDEPYPTNSFPKNSTVELYVTTTRVTEKLVHIGSTE